MNKSLTAASALGPWLCRPAAGEDTSIEPETTEDYIRCFRDSRTIAGTCADFRSAVRIDLVQDDEAFAGGQRVECPVLGDCRGRRARSVPASTCSASDSSTHLTSAATRCLPATSFPRSIGSSPYLAARFRRLAYATRMPDNQVRALIPGNRRYLGAMRLLSFAVAVTWLTLNRQLLEPSHNGPL